MMVMAYPTYAVTLINPMFYLLITLGATLVIWGHSDQSVRGRVYDILGTLMFGEFAVILTRSVYPIQLDVGFYIFIIVLGLCLIILWYKWRRQTS